MFMSAVRTLEVPGYQVIEFVGSGARSTIWQVKDQAGRICALKRVVRRHASDMRFLEQALNEYEMAALCDHPVVRKVYRLSRVRHWLALREVHLFMEWCEGQSVQDSRPADVREVVRIFQAVGEALSHINARGVVHADTKPNNIVVAPDGSVKLIDMGQSCPMGTAKERIQGTPDFIAPEQVHRTPLDARTDVYNFGASLYWALTGRPVPTVLPRERKSNLRSDYMVVPPEKYNEQVPSSLSKLIAECVELTPSRRPDSMAEVASRLGLIGHSLELRKAGGGGGKA
jgi:eukaryotic-like serine/threonine-protein kinase